ncbi:hypothetical protein JQ628_18475 [Bradyrhizobium lablabi]|uniref:hypothetical protein n=1 Tax=Bradyrhizobium lablabi TaxID=722472 RepID=UPI001BAA5876|nr:hypothetical protein [Bradyrhizobium lablabi]MBR1123516.1 hypothetical protein [Bradyrhizobium lablabi]
MVALEALNALYGDCLLLRYPGPDGKERFWIIDGGPRAGDSGGQQISVWLDVLLPRIEDIKDEINADPNKPLPVALGMVSHIDDDHIFGIMNLMQKLVGATAADPAAVKFDRFWFNSFEGLVGPKPAGMPADAQTASLQSLVSVQNLPGVADEHARMIMESVGQGITLASSLTTLGLQGNAPVRGLVVAKQGQQPFNIEGAKVTVIGPLQKRLDKLRKEWEKALQKPTKEARQAALQELFLPQKLMDSSVANLSSIVVLVEVGGKKLLLTGDANGNDIVTAWGELDLGPAPVLDVLKMPHHGSIRNCSEKFLRTFEAKHYVFSANGKFDNPDAPTLEALIKMHGNRDITMHFTNEDVTWKAPGYTLEKDGARVKNLKEMLEALRTAYPGPWKANARKAAEKSVVVELS